MSGVLESLLRDGDWETDTSTTLLINNNAESHVRLHKLRGILLFQMDVYHSVVEVRSQRSHDVLPGDNGTFGRDGRPSTLWYHRGILLEVCQISLFLSLLSGGGCIRLGDIGCCTGAVAVTSAPPEVLRSSTSA